MGMGCQPSQSARSPSLNRSSPFAREKSTPQQPCTQTGAMHKCIINKETVGDTKQPRVDSGMLPDGSVAREKRPQKVKFSWMTSTSRSVALGSPQTDGAYRAGALFFMLLPDRI